MQPYVEPWLAALLLQTDLQILRGHGLVYLSIEFRSSRSDYRFCIQVDD